MIRPATIMDLPWLRKLHQDFCAEFASPYPTMDPEEFDKFVVAVSHSLRSDPSFCCFVADDGNHPVAYIGGGVMQRACGKPNLVGTVFWLYVDASHRGFGIGKQLCATALGWLREKFPAVTTVEVPARAHDPQWLNRGFTPFLVYYHGPLSVGDVWLAGERPKPNGHDAPPAPKPRRKRKRPDATVESIQ